MSPLLLHSNTNQYNINGLLCTYTEMFRIQTCCNHILSAAEGFRGGGGGGGGGGVGGNMRGYFTKDPEAVHYFPGGGGLTFYQGGPNANFYRNTYTYLLFSRGSVRTPYPPLDPHMGNVILTGQYLSQSGLLP